MLRPYRERKGGEVPRSEQERKRRETRRYTRTEKASWRADARRYEKPYVKAD
jgi:hypothetical protein